MKIEKCPFCGGEAETFEASEDSFSILCTGCPVETPKDSRNIVTNADRIRSMNDEELAREMLFFVPSDFNRHYTGIAGGYYATADEAIQANFDWLKQPVKEE